MDLRTTYLGFSLNGPLMPGASPLGHDIGRVRELEDAGASAIVLPSLFEEEIRREELAADAFLGEPAEAFAEALSYFPASDVFARRTDAYLEHLRRVTEAVAVPVIASLNGESPGGWSRYARLMVESGAAAIELNLYSIATDRTEEGTTREARELEVVGAVRREVGVPVAVKLSPFYSSIPHFTARLESAGADGVVLYNRFYQPDIDPEALELRSELALSRPDELRLRLHALALLSPHTTLSLGATGGVHDALGAVKALMAGAHAVQMVSALLERGPSYLRTVRSELTRWLEEHEYDSLSQLIGSMNFARSPNPAAYERANYARLLSSWHG